MQASQKAIDLIKQYEGLRLQAYQDVGGVWSIGYGHIGPEVVKGLVWVPSQANFALVARINVISSILAGCVTPLLNQNQWDALVCLCYNIGQGAFRGSKLLKAINTRDEEGIRQEWLSWDHVKGAVVQGLLNRREAELALFMAPVEGLTG